MYTETFFFSKQEVHIGIERRHTDHWLLFCKDSQLLKDKMGKPGREMKMCKNSRIMPSADNGLEKYFQLWRESLAFIVKLFQCYWKFSPPIILPEMKTQNLDTILNQTGKKAVQQQKNPKETKSTNQSTSPPPPRKKEIIAQLL